MAEKSRPLAALAKALKKPLGQKAAPEAEESSAAEHLDGTAERFAAFYEFAPNMHEFLSFNGKGTAH